MSSDTRRGYAVATKAAVPSGCNPGTGVVSSSMAVSPGETTVYSRCWRSLVCAGLFSGAVVFGAALGQETQYFRIGTAATGGSFFQIGGIVATAISSPAEGPDCEHGGSC